MPGENDKLFISGGKCTDLAVWARQPSFREGWWRRRELNPRPKSLSAGRIHAQSSSACFRLRRSERTRCAWS